jgi:exonuclease VII large subunit
LNSRVPNIRTEYQALIDQQLLDSSTVHQALEKTQQALNSNNLAQSQGYLQALDDARIQVMKGLQEQWLPQIEYIEQRLARLRSRIPQALIQELQTNIDGAKNNWQQLTQADLDALHQRISTFENQADSIQQAAEKLAESYRQVGYAAYLGGIDNGDAVVQVETHEGVNTQIRLNFYGDRVNLVGPPEESNSCAARTVEALRRFREQGYQLEWTEWDGEPVAEDLRHLYSVASPISESQGEIEADSRSRRRRESEGH